MRRLRLTQNVKINLHQGFAPVPAGGTYSAVQAHSWCGQSSIPPHQEAQPRAQLFRPRAAAVWALRVPFHVTTTSSCEVAPTLTRSWHVQLAAISQLFTNFLSPVYTRYNLLSNRLSNRFDYQLNVCIHDTIGCQTGCQSDCQTRLTTGMTTG